MVLFDVVVEVLVLANLDGRFALGVDGLERGQNGPTFIDRYRLWGAVLNDRYFRIAPGSSLVAPARGRKSTVLPSLSIAR